jgi:hypothetical protein
MNFFRTRWIQLGALIALLGGIGIYSLREKYCVTDFDTWWHLKVGDWIIRNSALPHTGILSRTAAERAWVAYSWGYEVLLSLAYSREKTSATQEQRANPTTDTQAPPEGRSPN